MRDAERWAHLGTEREQSHVAAVLAHLRGDSRPIVDHLARYPVDALLLSAAVPTIAFAGVTEVPEQAWAIVEAAAPAYGDDWWYAGLLAFVRQEQERCDEAMDLACTSLAEQPDAGPLGARPGPRPLRDRRPRARPGLDGRLGDRRRRGDREPEPLLLARRAARAVGSATSTRCAAATTPSCARSSRPAAGPWSTAGSLLVRWALTPERRGGARPRAGRHRRRPRRAGAPRDAVPRHALRGRAARPRRRRRPAVRWPPGPTPTATPPSARSSPRSPARCTACTPARPRPPPTSSGRPRRRPYAASAGRTPSASSSRRSGSRPCCAPTASTRPRPPRPPPRPAPLGARRGVAAPLPHGRARLTGASS